MRWILLVFILIGCQTKPVSHDLDSVSLDTQDQSRDLKIDENSKGSYGPQKDSEKSKIAREPVVSLVLYPSIYHSQGLITHLKLLEDESVNISIISSFGFGSLLAALYAKQKSVSYLEWKLFSLLKKLKVKKPYSQEWKETLFEFIDDEFKDLKCNQLKVLLVIPERKNNQLQLNYSGSVARLLKNSLNIASAENIFSKFQPYNELIKEKLSADIVYSVGFLPSSPVVTNLKSIDYGVFTSYLGSLLTNSEKMGILKVNKRLAIDEIKLINDLETTYSDLIDKSIQALKDRIQKWKEDNTAASNNQ